MFDFLVATGKVGIIGICIVFIVVFVLARPGTEISFWGIKFHKKHRAPNSKNWRLIPKPLPGEWLIVLQAFAAIDRHHVPETAIFEETKRLNNLTELKTRTILADMGKFGVLRHSNNYVVLTERGLSLVNTLKKIV